MNRRRGNRVATSVVFALTMVLLPAGTATADHLDSAPEALEHLVCGFSADLDVLLAEFDLQAGAFGDDRLNRALVKARSYVENAQSATLSPDLDGAFRHLKAAMRELEKGAAVPISGSGFADDIASFGSFFAETFTADLLALVLDLQLVPPSELSRAIEYLNAGKAERVNGEWEAALVQFSRSVRSVSSYLVTEPPSCLS